MYKYLCAGAASEPELLQHMFHCLASICKHLLRQVAAELPLLLKNTAKLRYNEAEHVRKAAASTFAYVLRHCTILQLRQAIKVVFAGKPFFTQVIKFICYCCAVLFEHTVIPFSQIPAIILHTSVPKKLLLKALLLSMRAF